MVLSNLFDGTESVFSLCRKGLSLPYRLGTFLPRGLDKQAADVELDMFACEIAWILQLHLYPEDLLAVDLLPSHVTSCIYI